MGRSIEITGESIVYLFYAVTLAIVPVVFYFIVWPLTDLVSVFLMLPLAALVLYVLGGFYNVKVGNGRYRIGSGGRDGPYDITYDPYADPGQAAKDTWGKAVRRLPGEGEDDDEE